jgi:hypothetical protein
MSNETFGILLISLLIYSRSIRYLLYFYFIYSEEEEEEKKKFIMLLHNNTLATATFLSTAESPSSTTSVYSHPNPQTSFSSPWIQQRLLTEQFFVRIMF